MILHALNIQRIKYRHHIRKASTGAIVLCLCAVVGIGAYKMASRYIWATTEAQNAVKQAEADRDQVVAVLNGKLAMVDQSGKYAKVAQVSWVVVEVAD